jgi:DNA-binding GntR family transcriptional regulator
LINIKFRGGLAVVYGRTTTEHIWEALREMILDGRLAGGARLKEVELAKEFGTSRTPIREVLLRLQSEELVDRLPNSGAMVKALDEHDVDGASQLRALLGLRCGPRSPALGRETDP